MVRRKAKDYLKSGKKSRQASISSANNQSLSKSVSACGRIHARAVSPGVQLDVVRADSGLTGVNVSLLVRYPLMGQI